MATSYRPAKMRLILLGRRGSGKSSCGNTILGSKVFQSFLSTTPVTIECEEHTTEIQGREVTVIDTPDFFGDCLPHPDRHIKKCISMAGLESRVFLLVIQLGRFSEGEKKIVTHVQEAFGSSVTQNMIVLFSYGDDLEGVTIEDFLKHAQPELRNLLEQCGNRYHVFNNRDTGRGPQVTELLQKVYRMLAGPKEVSLKQRNKTPVGSSTCAVSLSDKITEDTRCVLETQETSTKVKDFSHDVHELDVKGEDSFSVTKRKRRYGVMNEFIEADNITRHGVDMRKLRPANKESTEDLDNRRNRDNKKSVTQNFSAGPEPQARIATGHDSKRDDSVTQRMPKHVVYVRDMQNVKSFTQSDNGKNRVKEKVNLVLLGRRGSGKSSCGNTILGSKVFQSFLSTTPVTIECEEHTTEIQGRVVTVIDTPDFFGDCLPHPDRHIKKCISMAGLESRVFLLVIQLGRFSEGEKKIVTHVQEAFGSSVTQNMIVLFSYGDDLEGVTIEDFLKHAQPELRNLLEQCGNRYHVFNNRDTGRGPQVTELLQKVYRMLAGPKEVSLKQRNKTPVGSSTCAVSLSDKITEDTRCVLETQETSTKVKDFSHDVHELDVKGEDSFSVTKRKRRYGVMNEFIEADNITRHGVDMRKLRPANKESTEDLVNRRNRDNKKSVTQNFSAGPEPQARIATGHDSKRDDSVTQRMPKHVVYVRDMQNVKSFTQSDNGKNRVKEKVNLVLLGRRGSGKSSCGNTILGSKVFQSFLSTTPVTIECEEHTTEIQGREVTVIDTPDFFGDCLPHPDRHIKKCISMAGRESRVFLLVIQLGRFSEGEKKIVTHVQEAFGSSVTQNMIVLFSYGDDLEGVTIEDFLKHAQPELRNLLEQCGNRYHVFNNRDTGHGPQVTELLQKVYRMLAGPKEVSLKQRNKTPVGSSGVAVILNDNIKDDLSCSRQVMEPFVKQNNQMHENVPCGRKHKMKPDRRTTTCMNICVLL